MYLELTPIMVRKWKWFVACALFGRMRDKVRRDIANEPMQSNLELDDLYILYTNVFTVIYFQGKQLLEITLPVGDILRKLSEPISWLHRNSGLYHEIL
jgi:hypothetical protein